MKWLSIEDKIPSGPGIIIAIMEGRTERGDDPIQDATIVILRSMWENDEWRTMDCCEVYYLPNENESWDRTIKYWMPWEEFEFPSSMINHFDDKETNGK